MLVFSRRRNEEVEITLPTDPEELAKLAGHIIRVRYVETLRGQARLGFEADRSIDIDRKEVADRIRAA